MTRVFTDGAEMGDTLFWDAPNGGGATTTIKRSGNYSYFTNASSIGRSIVALSEYYFRFGWQIANVGNNYTIHQWKKAGTVLGSLRVNSASQKWELYVGASTLVATSTTSISPNTFYLIELHIKIDDATGALSLRIDGSAEEAIFSGDTKPGADTTVDILMFPTANVNQYFDDLALNDTTGGVDNSWCGDGHVLCLTPNAAGDVTQWIPFPSTGTNYDMVNDIPADGNATYVYQTGTASYDLYNLTTTVLPTTIYRVWSEARAKDTVAEGGEISLLVKTNGVIYTGSSVALLTSFTKQIPGSVYTTNPQTGLAWSLSELDALQVGVMLRS